LLKGPVTIKAGEDITNTEFEVATDSATLQVSLKRGSAVPSEAYELRVHPIDDKTGTTPNCSVATIVPGSGSAAIRGIAPGKHKVMVYPYDEPLEKTVEEIVAELWDKATEVEALAGKELRIEIEAGKAGKLSIASQTTSGNLQTASQLRRTKR